MEGSSSGRLLQVAVWRSASSLFSLFTLDSAHSRVSSFLTYSAMILVALSSLYGKPTLQIHHTMPNSHYGKLASLYLQRSWLHWYLILWRNDWIGTFDHEWFLIFYVYKPAKFWRSCIHLYPNSRISPILFYSPNDSPTRHSLDHDQFFSLCSLKFFFLFYKLFWIVGPLCLHLLFEFIMTHACTHTKLFIVYARGDAQ